MPIHDWTRVEDGIFHHFHHSWIEEIMRALNAGLLPSDHYALAEQHAAGYGPDVLTLEYAPDDGNEVELKETVDDPGGGLLLAAPRVRLTAETELDFYRRKQSTVVVRHVSGDRIVAMVEIVSPGNKSSRKPLNAFVEKTGRLIDRGIHLLILDLQPPSSRDPSGIHGAIWDYMTGILFAPPADKPLTLVAYECDLALRAYIEPVAVGDALIDMPLFLKPGAHVPVPLERTYQAAFNAVPRRWRSVLSAER